MNTKGRRAVNALIDIALREQVGAVPLSAIAHRQHVSISYLEQLFAQLRVEGLVRSTRGPGGGYCLGREPAAITVADIVEAVETGTPRRPDDGDTVLGSEVWQQLKARMRAHLADISLAKLTAGKRATDDGSDVVPRRSGVEPRPQRLPFAASTPNSVFDLAKMMGMASQRQHDKG
jgi:Rrf2 family iron-sulfur cluster assembly transcriptional regulator